MKSVTFVTTNDVKFGRAMSVAKELGLKLERSTLDFEEIQADGEAIARHKAKQAFGALQKPVIVTDDSWDIPGLNGFPGTYMKPVNEWLTPQDWLNLTRELKDRRVFIRHHCIYQDQKGQHYFVDEIPGTLLRGARGDSKYPSLAIISFDGGQRSYAEDVEAGIYTSTRANTVWHQLAAWLTT